DPGGSVSGDAADVVAGPAGVLLVVDYAERWPVSDLLALVHDQLSRPVPVRVLLLARSAGAWWQGVVYRLDRADITAESMVLGPVVDTLQGRAQVFAAARDRFAVLLQVADAGQIPLPARLDHDAY